MTLVRPTLQDIHGCFHRLREEASVRLPWLQKDGGQEPNAAIHADLIAFAKSYGIELSMQNTPLVQSVFFADTVAIFLTRLLFLRLLLDEGLFDFKKHRWSELPFFDRERLLSFVRPDARAVVSAELSALDGQVFGRLERHLFGPPHKASLAQVIEEVGSWTVAHLDEQLLGEFYQGILDPEKRKQVGEYYTPASIVTYLLEQMIGPNENIPGRLLDPACGFGTFLVQASHHYQRLWADKAPSNLNKLLQEALVGFDINPFSAAVTRFLLVWNYLRSCGNQKVEDVSFQTFTLNSLERGKPIKNSAAKRSSKTEPARDELRYRFVVGNPPYVRAERLKNGAQLKAEWADVWQQNSDASILFLYRALTEWLEPGGLLGVVVSGGIANADAAQPFLSLLQTRATLKEVVWLECVSNVWDAGVIPMLLIVENRPPCEDDEVKVSVPTSWPATSLPVQSFRYREYFHPSVNPSGYLLPLLQKDDLPILHKISGKSSLGDHLKFKYGIQRGTASPLYEAPRGIEPVPVIDGKSVTMFGHGDEIGWVDLSTVQKRALWPRETYMLPPGSYQLQLDAKIFDDAGYIAVPTIVKAPTAAYVETLALPCLDTCAVAKHPNPNFLKSVVLYLNSSTARFVTLVQLRAGILQGSHRLHMYPRTIELLPWPKHIPTSILSELARLHDSLVATARNCGPGLHGNSNDFLNLIQVADQKIAHLFGLSHSDTEYISKRLSGSPLNDLTPRYPWEAGARRRPKGYNMDRFHSHFGVAQPA